MKTPGGRNCPDSPVPWPRPLQELEVGRSSQVPPDTQSPAGDGKGSAPHVATGSQGPCRAVGAQHSPGGLDSQFS